MYRHLVQQFKDSNTQSINKTKEPNYVPGYHLFEKPIKQKVKRKITFWGIIEVICGFILYFWTINQLSNKLINKNNYTWHKDL